MTSSPVRFLRRIAIAEGVSYLLLLGIAMPLKYLANFPQAVSVVGWLHGALFVGLCAALLHTMVAARWPFLRGAVVFIAAVVPFGPFLLDRRMAAWELEKGRP